MNRSAQILLLAVLCVVAIAAALVARRESVERRAGASQATRRTTAAVRATALPRVLAVGDASSPVPLQSVAVVVQTPDPASAASSPSSAAASARATATPARAPALSRSGASAARQAILPSAEPGTAAPDAIVAPNAPPRILRVAVSSTTVSSGDVVSGEVDTSSNVASVEARVAGYGIGLEKTAPGTFALRYRVPRIPFFLRHAYDVQVIARNVRGDAVSALVPVRVK